MNQMKKRTIQLHSSHFLMLDPFFKDQKNNNNSLLVEKYRRIKKTRRNSNILVILSCTKKKLDHPAPAAELYQGDVFKKAQIWINRHNFSEVIISAKYGLVRPDEILKPYNKRIKTKSDAISIQNKIIPKLRNLVQNKKAIVIIMGNLYVEALKPLLEELKLIPIFRLKSKNGIFDYKKNVKELLKGNLEVFYQYSGPKTNINYILENS